MGSKPVAFKPIRTVGLGEEALKENVQGFEERGWTEGSKSPLVGRRFLVLQPGVSKWRLVIDYEYLNECLKGHELPLLVIEDLMEREHGNRLWTILDSSTGSTQMPLTEESCLLTAFCTPLGVYQWNALAMGLKRGPQAYQRMFTHCIRNLPTLVGAYIDDLPVGASPSKASMAKGKVLDSCVLDEEATTEHCELVRHTSV